MRRFISFPKRLAAVAGLACAAALAPAAAFAATTSAPHHATAGVPRCATSGLVVWLNVPPGNDYAGGAFYYLEFNNQSGHACTLRGSPGVSAVSLSGRPLGSAAGGDYSGHVPAIMLADGATATAKLQIADTGNFGTRCFVTQPTPGNPGILPTAAGLRVYPPNQTVSKVIPYPLRACAHAGPIYMGVSPVTLSVVPPGI
jgi:Protein of unknown function (DUF4232)